MIKEKTLKLIMLASEMENKKVKEQVISWALENFEFITRLNSGGKLKE